LFNEQVMIEKKDALDDIIKKSAVVRVDRSDVVEEEVRKLQHQPIESSKDVDSEEKILVKIYCTLYLLSNDLQVI